MIEKYKQFWIEDNLNNVAREDSLIQGEWDTLSYLKDLKDYLKCKTVLDFGCGFGRHSVAFNPKEYLGVDINPKAIKEARYSHPNHEFQEITLQSKYPVADLYLVFTVFLHLDDASVRSSLRKMRNTCRKYIVIIEALGREWRNPNVSLPLFNRDLDEYVLLLKEQKFHLRLQDRFYNPHYGENPEHKDKNCYTNILIFGR